MRTKYSNLAIYFLVVILIACEGKNKNSRIINHQTTSSPENKFQYNETYDWGGIKLLTKNNLPVNGFVLSYNEDGSISSEQYYINGILNGQSKYFHNNGTLSRRENYKDGKEDGSSMSWFDNGRQSVEAYYSEGKIDGSYTRWYSDGTISEIAHYVKGLRKGIQCRFSEDGNLLYKVNLKNGNGQITYVDPETKCTISKNYENGVPIEIEEGKKLNKYIGPSVLETNFEKGHLVSERIFRIENGKENVTSSKNFLHGLLHGKLLSNIKDGKPYVEENYYYGQLDGLNQSWHENGQLKEIAKYNRGILLSKKCWDESGKSIECECYNNDRVKIKCP